MKLARINSASRSFAHHYGSVGRDEPARQSLRVYAPLGWGVLPQVRAANIVNARSADPASNDGERQVTLVL